MLLVALVLASDTWSDPLPGVRLLRRTTSDPLRIYALEVDLCERGVSLRATDVDERERTVSSFASLVGAEAAINGDFFSYDTYYPSGMAIGDGSHWNADNTSEGFASFGRDRAWISPPDEIWSTPAEWMDQAVGGRPLLVDEGVAGTSFSDPSHCADLHPRTAVGLSRDRQTLWLVVVDGRSSASEGMSCPDLAALMHELGAWTALNLDGGGSSAMWVSGLGVVNDPSDGSERVVSNHLAVHAGGSEPAESCDFWEAEVVWDAGLLDAGPTDFDGDGTADACARAAAGWRCHPSGPGGFGDPWTSEVLADGDGWSDPDNYATLRTGDVDGDGRDDLCARGDAGVWCWPSTGTGLGAGFSGPALADDVGWADPRYASTLRLADVDGDGRADACARAAAGVRCYPSTGTGFGDPVTTDWLADGSGGADPSVYGSLRVGDVNGDGRADLCARTPDGVRCRLGPDLAVEREGPGWSDAAGWSDVSRWSTLRLVDLDGDGDADLCGRGAAGVECARSTPTGFAAPFAGPALSDDTGWGDHANYATLRFADVDGDGDRDLLARADARVYAWLQEGDAFPTRVDGPEWSDAAGWDDPRLYTTLRVGDLDGDGDEELCGRGADGLRCATWDGAALVESLAGPTWSDGSGWDGLPYFSTIRLGGPRRAPADGPTDGPVDTADPDAGSPPRAERVPAHAGCGCGTGAPLLPALLLAALPLARRYRYSSPSTSRGSG